MPRQVLARLCGVVSHTNNTMHSNIPDASQNRTHSVSSDLQVIKIDLVSPFNMVPFREYKIGHAHSIDLESQHYFLIVGVLPYID